MYEQKGTNNNRTNKKTYQRKLINKQTHPNTYQHNDASKQLYQQQNISTNMYQQNTHQDKTFKKQNISIKNFERNLYTKNLPDPDLLIRTGGKKRLSNFLLWQLAYSELYFLDKLWPDFTTSDFNKIIKNFKRVKRNFGKI